MRFIDHYEVLLLDMGLTFMFFGDRFTPETDFHTTWQKHGGTGRPPETITAIILALFEEAMRTYEDAAYYDEYPQLHALLAPIAREHHLSEDEQAILLNVFAAHEIGHVPHKYIACLRRLRETHRLGLVSNVWAPSPLFRNTLAELEVAPLFEHLFFSSDHGHIKPSPLLFTKVLDAFGIQPTQALFIGDNLRCDIGGAQNAGIPTVWINATGATLRPNDPTPTVTVRSLLELESLQATPAGNSRH